MHLKHSRSVKPKPTKVDDVDPVFALVFVWLEEATSAVRVLARLRDDPTVDEREDRIARTRRFIRDRFDLVEEDLAVIFPGAADHGRDNHDPARAVAEPACRPDLPGSGESGGRMGSGFITPQNREAAPDRRSACAFTTTSPSTEKPDVY